jgi:hypothetical protein
MSTHTILELIFAVLVLGIFLLITQRRIDQRGGAGFVEHKITSTGTGKIVIEYSGGASGSVTPTHENGGVGGVNVEQHKDWEAPR